MKLEDLIDGVSVKSVANRLDTEVADLCFDSRKAGPGSAFFALRGVDADGHDHIDSALEKGAVAVIAETPYPANTEAAWVQVKNSRRALALASANFHGDPSSGLPLVGVTGTNGKTTTALLVHHLLQSSLGRAGMLGTIEYVLGEERHPAPHTTPEAPHLQEMLAEMRDAGCRAAAMEVSSHGLAQDRVTGVHFDVGVFTNLSQDHLDYHRSMDAYFEAKCRLFELMEKDTVKRGTMVANRDDRWGERLLKHKRFALDTLTFGQSVGSDFQFSKVRCGFDGTQFVLRAKGRQYLVRIPLIGFFNAHNATAALAAASALGLNMREAVAHLADCPQVPGRLENVRGVQTNYRVYVDYAHTPDALENALRALRDLKPVRIITVFGCGGDRDRTKRKSMAEAVEAGSDLAILTSDNPRSEDPAAILRDAARGFRKSGHEIVEDRREAIARAVELAGEKDIVLVAGKGHETYQEIEGVRHDFDDRHEAFVAMVRRAERGGEEWESAEGDHRRRDRDSASGAETERRKP